MSVFHNWISSPKRALRWYVAMASAPAATTTAVANIGLVHSGLADERRRKANVTTRATIAARRRYMRYSANASNGIGTTLELGASSRKNHAPRKPVGCRRQTATTVANNTTARSPACNSVVAGGVENGAPVAGPP